jgi:transposase
MDFSVYKKMPSPKIGSQSKYPDHFRRKVAEDYLLTDMSYKDVQELHNLPTKGIVTSFIRWYKNKYDLSALELDASNDSLVQPKSLEEKEIFDLLHQVKLKIVALETMIDIAEDELGIDIRKKSGSKPSKK